MRTIFLTHRARMERKRLKSFLYRTLHQNKKPHIVMYIIQILLSVIADGFRMVLKILFFIIMSLIMVGMVGICVLIVWGIPVYHQYDRYAMKVVQESEPSDFQIDESSTIYNKNGNPIVVLHEGADLMYLTYDEIPANVVNAFVAVEDQTYWTNSGIDYRGMVRVFLGYIISRGGEAHGASTITQQVTRRAYLSNEVSLERKLKEICISQHLTEKYSKKDIIEFYINSINYGNNIYGIAGAARNYFDKDAKNLTLSQTAYLCALPNRPSAFNPYKNPEAAIPRRNKILDDMVKCGFITETEASVAKKEDIVIKRPTAQYNNYEATYATDCAVRYLMKLDGFNFQYKFIDDMSYKKYHEDYNDFYTEEKHKLYTGGYSIYTSLDHGLYKKLQSALDGTLSFSKETDENTGVYTLQGALTCIDNESGNVIAVVGGRSQDAVVSGNKIYTFNRAYQTYRQPGSSIKPLVVYTPALMKNYTADTQVENIDVSEANKKEIDIESLHGNPVTLRHGVEQSLNGVAMNVFHDITPEYGMSFIETMHYSNLCKDDYYDVAALGGFTNGVTTVEQAGGYSALANNGVWKEPTCITSFKTKSGEELFRESEKKQVYSVQAAENMKDILEGVLTSGTAAELKWSSSSKKKAFGKTGTTNKSWDGWFCGSTDDYTVAVWVGYDQPKELKDLYGATYPGQIWKKAMLAALGE